MSDTPQSPQDISALYTERRKTRDPEISIYNEVEGAVLNGTLPKQYESLFTESDVRIQLRTIRSADEGLFKFLREIPVLPRADVLGKRTSDKARDKAELVEQICFGYHNGTAMRGGAEFGAITGQLATDQVRFGDGCLLTHFDTDRKLVYLEAKDPRCFYAPKGWHPWSISPLDGGLIVYETTLGEVKRRYAYTAHGKANNVAQRLENQYAKHWGGGRTPAETDSIVVKLGIYRSRAAWFLVALGDTDIVLAQSVEGDKNHPGVCGMASFKQYRRGPIFEGQIGLEAGLEKVINQQIQNTERINKATTIGPPLLKDELVIGGYNEVNMQLMSGKSFQPHRMAPDSPTNLTQVMGSFLSLAQMFNYNPESNQGSGEANSGKAINALQAGPRSLVTNVLWAPYEVAFPRVYDDCMEGELNLWPNDKKTTYGRNGRQTYETDYTPASALEGFRGRVKIEEPRLGGYNAFLEAVQKRDAGMLDLRSTLEKDPDVRDVEQTIRRIDAEATEKFIQAAFEGAGAQNPLLAAKAGSKILDLINSGKSKAEAIKEVIESGMLEPPAPDPAVAPPGMPPELAAVMGGGGMETPPPSLADARGF